MFNYFKISNFIKASNFIFDGASSPGVSLVIFLFFAFTQTNFLVSQVNAPIGVTGPGSYKNNSGAMAATGSSQCAGSTNSFCDFNPNNSALIMNTGTNKEFVFDSFSKYMGGITLNGTTILKVKVANHPTNVGDCQWKLQMIVSNGGTAQTFDPNEWETLSSYSSGSGPPPPKPTIDILQIKIDNGCHTPKNFGIMLPPFTTHDDVVDIINPTAAAGHPPGPGAACSGQETNEEGTYLGLDYSEYSFIIDYRVDPGFVFTPGRYELSIKFCLTEK